MSKSLSPHPQRTLEAAFSLGSLMLAVSVHAVEVDGYLDLRFGSATGASSWTHGGLGKLRTDSEHDGVQLGQGNLIILGDVSDTVSGNLTLSASADHHARADITEAWLKWRPIPTSAWRTTVRAGAFFPPGSLENDGPGWSTTRTLSASAINSWIGEEIRVKGLEVDVFRPGRFANSAHDAGVTIGAFNDNDPAGTLLAWRGWSIGDRITGLTETLPLPPLPVYEEGGPLYGKQAPELDNFHEIDHRIGYYAAARYGFADQLTVMALHYDNRANPRKVSHRQYAWDTHYNEVSMRWTPNQTCEFIAQTMRGMTMMGPRAVYVNFDAWFALGSYRRGPDIWTARYDHFRTRQNDKLPWDNNDEDGHGLTLAWAHATSDTVSLVGEVLQVQSNRPERRVLGQATVQHERAVQLAVRMMF